MAGDRFMVDVREGTNMGCIHDIENQSNSSQKERVCMGHIHKIHRQRKKHAYKESLQFHTQLA